MAKIKVDRSKFNKVFESIRKESKHAAEVYLKLLQKEFMDESISLGNSIQNVISDSNAFSFLPDRDIILTGELKRSQKVSYRRLSGAIHWPVRSPDTNYPYANAVYHGWKPWGVGKFIPGRKYPELGLKRKPNLRLQMKVESTSKGLIAYIVPILDKY